MPCPYMGVGADGVASRFAPAIAAVGPGATVAVVAVGQRTPDIAIDVV